MKTREGQTTMTDLCSRPRWRGVAVRWSLPEKIPPFIENGGPPSRRQSVTLWANLARGCQLVINWRKDRFRLSSPVIAAPATACKP